MAESEEGRLTRANVRLPMFYAEKFMLWWLQILAYATACKFREAMTDTPEADLPASESEVLGG